MLGLPSSLRRLLCEVEGRASLGGDGPISSLPTCLSKLACFFLSVFLVLKVGKGLSQLMVVGERGSAGRIRSLAIMQVSFCHNLNTVDHIVTAMKQDRFTYVLIANAPQAAAWVAGACLLIFLLAASHDRFLVVLLDCLDCESARHTGTTDYFEAGVAFGHAEEGSHYHFAGTAPGTAPGRAVGTATRRSIRSAHIADRCIPSAWRSYHGMHLGLAECIHRGPRDLGQDVHLSCLLVDHTHSPQGLVVVEVAAALGADSMAVSTSQ